MDDTKPLTIDGFVYTVPAPGDGPGTARFQLVVSPTDDTVDDVVWSCTTSDPRIADALLTEIEDGDLLHVSGFLTQFDARPACRRRTGAPGARTGASPAGDGPRQVRRLRRGVRRRH